MLTIISSCVRFLFFEVVYIFISLGKNGETNVTFNNGFFPSLTDVYRGRHKYWYGISNGCGIEMAQAISMRFFLGIYYEV